MVGTHTDSPCFKIAPASKVEKHGFKQINVMKYGGGLWRTWFDRDLTLAGKIIVMEKGKLVSKLWNAKKPIVCLPSLCIHLDRSEEFKPNVETHCKPMIATSIVD